MIREGTRIYSIQEIKELLGKDIDNKFLVYMKRLPEDIQDLMISWIPDEEKRSQTKNELKKVILDVISESNELEKREFGEDVLELNESVSSEIDMKKNSTECIESSINTDEDSQESIDESLDQIRKLYESITFKDRINVPVLLIKISEEQECPVHKSKFQKLQAMLPSFGGTKRYSMMVNCCSECKRFYMTEEELQNREQILEARFVKYLLDR